MSSSTTPRFLLITERLIILPTPFAILDASYLSLYAALHADEKFCSMGFGNSWPARKWDQEQVYDQVLKEVKVNWEGIAKMGDCAIGLRPTPVDMDDSQTSLDGKSYRILKGEGYERFIDSVKNTIQWCGYVGVRNALTRLSPPETGNLPDWPEMIEMRYGIAPSFWGQGIAPEAAKAIMAWSIDQRGTKRFIAETEKANTRSARVLRKLGFVESGTSYWQDPTLLEWERRSTPQGV